MVSFSPSSLLHKAAPKYPFGKPPEGTEVYWRVEARSYSYVIDADREEYGSTGPQLEIYWFEVERKTPKGAWIRVDGLRFVCNSWNKRFACPTEAEALASFAARKRRRIKILEAQLQYAKRELALL